MESMKHKFGMALLVLALIAAAVGVWYLIAVMPDKSQMDGTLVKAINGLEMMFG